MFTPVNIFVASGLALFVALLGVMPFFRRRPAFMHVLWLLVLVKFITPAFIAVPLLPAGNSQAIPNQILPPIPSEAPHEIIAAVASEPKPQIATATRTPIPWTAVLLTISLAGTAVIIIHSVLNFLSLRRLVEHSDEDPRLTLLLKTCQKKMNLSRAPNAKVINARCSPFLLAIPRHSCIYIPHTMLDTSTDADLEPILCHELAHHLRRDALANLFAFFVTALLWWNPLAWLARRQLRNVQELCCDALVISRHSISRRDYAKILLSTLDQLTGASSIHMPLATGWGNVSSLKGRFRMIGDRNVNAHLSRTWLLAAMLLFIALLCIPTRAQSKAAALPVAKTPVKSKIWKAQLIDADNNNQPIPNIEIHVNAVAYTTDDNGIVTVSIPEDGRAMVSLASQGWWSQNMNMLGGTIEVRKPGEKEPPPPDPNKPTQIKAWRGTVVTGRLLDPDTRPIPNATLVVGTYIISQEWKTKLGMDLTFNSWDHGDWANWGYHFNTDAKGQFEITIPPDDARSWVRISTMEFGSNYDNTLDPNGPGKALVNYAPFEKQIDAAVSVDGKFSFGDLQVTRGTVLRGKVVDAQGKPLSGITLYTSSKHGPYFGRTAVSGADGSYQFLPMHPGGPFTLSPYAQLKDEKGNANSRDVQAVFIPQEINLPESKDPVEMTIRAVPHILLEFDWIDRRAKKGPVSYYGEFTLHGQVKLGNGTTAHWRGETEMTTRDGKPIVFIKVPAVLKTPTLTLPADSVVTASYEDDQQKSGPGTFELKDITTPRHRIIYGDEPTPRKP